MATPLWARNVAESPFPLSSGHQRRAVSLRSINQQARVVPAPAQSALPATRARTCICIVIVLPALALTTAADAAACVMCVHVYAGSRPHPHAAPTRASAGRVVIGVHADEVPAMLAWLAPQLARTCAHMLTRASSDQARGPRGASIILNGEAESSSGPHKDSEPTLLLAVSGARRVWCAAPDDVTERVQLRATQARLGAPTFLPPEYDPTCNAPRAGVRWCEPITLKAGYAMWIPAGWWHCVLSAPHAVAVPCEIAPQAFLGQKPRVLPHAAPTKQHGSRPGLRISARPGWASAKSVSRVFAALTEDVEAL